MRIFRHTFLVSIISALLFAPLSAHADDPPSTQVDDHPSIEEAAGRVVNSLTHDECALNGDTGVTCGIVTSNATYKMGRIDPGVGTEPIDIWGICRYVDNLSVGTSHPVFWNNTNEWQHTVNSSEHDFHFTRCALPWTPPAAPADINAASPTYCGSPSLATGPDAFPYERVGGTGRNAVAQYNCSCMDGSHWTQTATQFYIPAFLADNDNVSRASLNASIAGWQASGAVVYSGIKPSGCDTTATVSTDCASTGTCATTTTTGYDAVKIAADCSGLGGVDYGLCQWGGDRNTTVSGFNWQNAAYVCSRAGYKYVVGGRGSNGRGDCSHCRWAMWKNSDPAQPAASTLASYEVPPPNSEKWSAATWGSWSSASKMSYAWCSNTPNQHVPYDCRGGLYTFQTQKPTGPEVCTGGNFFSQKTCTTPTETATVTVIMPDAYFSDMEYLRPVSTFNPSDTGPVLYANTDEGVYQALYTKDNTDAQPSNGTMRATFPESPTKFITVYPHSPETFKTATGTRIASSGTDQIPVYGQCTSSGQWRFFTNKTAINIFMIGRFGKKDYLLTE